MHTIPFLVKEDDTKEERTLGNTINTLFDPVRFDIRGLIADS